jgi:hypothetical protein
MNKNHKASSKKSLWLSVVAIVLVVSVMGVIQVGKAQQEKSPVAELTDLANALKGDTSAFEAGLTYLGEQVGNAVFGAVGTRFPHGVSVGLNAASPTENGLNVDATSTVQEITLGSRYVVDLTLTATSTTPGTAGYILNSGATKICQRVEVEITSASNAGGRAGAGAPFDISVGTSTSATAWSGIVGPGLIASTTIATSTTVLYDSVAYEGGGVTDGSSFLWENGKYIVVGFDGKVGDPATSTAALTNMDGKLYVICHTR